MKFIIFSLFICSQVSGAEAVNPFKVDTSVNDIKPEKKIAIEEIAPIAETKRDYRPNQNYQPLLSPFTRSGTNAGLHMQESRNQAARGMPSN